MDAHHDPFAASAPRLHALGATAQAELAHVRARPELAALDVRAGGDSEPGGDRRPMVVICAIDLADENAMPALESAAREGRRDGAHAVVLIVPHGRLDEGQRRRLAAHLGACVLAAAPGPGAMLEAAIALATPLVAPGLTCFHVEGVAGVLRPGRTGEVRRARLHGSPGDGCGDVAGLEVIAVVARAHEGTRQELVTFADHLEAALPGLAGLQVGTPDGLVGERGDVTLFLVEVMTPEPEVDHLGVRCAGIVYDRQVLPTTTGREIAQLVVDVHRTATWRAQPGQHVRCIALPEVWARIAELAQVGAMLEIVGGRMMSPRDRSRR